MRVKISCCLLAAAVFVTGCSGPSKQLAAVQEDKEQLLATIRQQRDANRTLQGQVASLESRLDQAEKELARRGGTTRVSTRPDSPPPVKNEPLPWRTPTENQSPAPSKPTASPAASQGGQRSARPAPAALSLAALADRDRRLQYDPQSHAARMGTPIEFDGSSATLSAAGKQQLDEVSRFLKSDPARELRIMVAGYAAGRPSTTAPVAEGESRVTSARQLGATRAQAVADYLDRHGIAQERLAVTGVGSRDNHGDSATSGGGVEIYLLEPETTVVGWAPENGIRR